MKKIIKTVLEKFDKKFWLEITSEGTRGVTPKQYEELKNFISNTVKEVWSIAQDEEQNDIWKWIGENS